LEKSGKKGIKDKDNFFAINEKFHQLLLNIADNRFRDQMVADLRKVMKLNRAQSLTREGRIEHSLEEHRAIMTALAKRDSKATAKAMQAHILAGLQAAG
jgi:DNA-binding GntR family transcriptional regulator